MAKTIIQTIGPLYGDVVNGTVFGRPNGSVYVPPTNKIVFSVPTGYEYIRKIGNNVRVCNSSGSTGNASFVAESQDIASYVQIQLSDSSDFTTYTSRNLSAGLFNTNGLGTLVISADFTVTDGTSYYVRAVLMASTNVPVATSEVVTVTGVEV